jgi:hypothetical protein
MIVYGFIALTYVVVLAVTVSGLIKLALKDNATVRLIHKCAAPPAIVLWTIVMYGAIFVVRGKWIVLSLLFTLFLMLIFAGSLTGWLANTKPRQILHMILGGLTFALFTYFIFNMYTMLSRA